MNPSKQPAETQQSYFYVVWPEAEDKSTTASSVAATTNAAASVVMSTIPSSSSDLPTISYESRALTSSSTNHDSSSNVQQEEESPVNSPQRNPLLGEVAMTSSNASLSPCTRSTSDVQSPSQQHATAAIPCNMAIFPSMDSYNAGGSVRRHKTVATPEYSPAKPKFHRSMAVGDRESNMREIGALAKQALLNLQKIVLVTGSPGSATSPVTPIASSKDLPASKRRRLWDHTDSSSCMECEVKDAEINILRKRIQKMQEQAEQVMLPNGNDTVQSRLPPPEEEVPVFKPLQLSETPPLPPQLLEEHPLVVQQSQRPLKQPSQAVKASKSTSVASSSDNQSVEQSSEDVVKQEYVELASGSGVYIPACKLEEATRDAKTGTQLARKLMDAFWDKDTLARSTLTPRSKFQYRQLDPTVIKSIEAYCLYHDNSLHSKDIHATMTDKCCQARSKYRSLNPQMYTSE